MFGRKKQKELTEESNKRTLLDEKIRELNTDLIDLGSIKDFFVASFTASLALFLLIIYSYLNKRGALFWFYVIITPLYTIASVVCLKALIRFIKKIKEEHNIALKEREAERKVQKFLKDNLTEDYHLFENIYTGYGDIDVIVVGRTGVFMIEVKSNSGLVAENEKGYLSIIDGIAPNKNYREQVGKELSQVKRYIDNNTGFSSWVYPILVFPFGSVMKELVLESEYDKLKLPVLNEKDLLEYIYSNNQTKLTSDQIKKISKVLEEWQKD